MLKNYFLFKLTGILFQFTLTFQFLLFQKLTPLVSQFRTLLLRNHLKLTLLCLGLKFSADFNLRLRWNDLRLQFLDLNTNTIVNALSANDFSILWQPEITFLNALGTINEIGNPSGSIIREGKPMKENLNRAIEG